MLAQYEINLLELKEDSKEFNFQVNDGFFEAIGSTDIQKGDVRVSLHVNRLADESYECSFRMKGIVHVLCDRCLDEMPYGIDATNQLIIKLGSDYLEEDDIITILEEEGVFDASSYIYQFIVLSIPIKHVHAPGKCNAQMIEALREHLATRSDEEDDDELLDVEGGESDDENRPIDPRWSELLKIKNNN